MEGSIDHAALNSQGRTAHRGVALAATPLCVYVYVYVYVCVSPIENQGS
jgi:hypothetical protein